MPVFISRQDGLILNSSTVGDTNKESAVSWVGDQEYLSSFNCLNYGGPQLTRRP